MKWIYTLLWIKIILQLLLLLVLLVALGSGASALSSAELSAVITFTLISAGFTILYLWVTLYLHARRDWARLVAIIVNIIAAIWYVINAFTPDIQGGANAAASVGAGQGSVFWAGHAIALL